MKEKKTKRIVLRNNSQKEKERVLKAFRLAFVNKTDLNLKIGEGYIFYVGGILSKLDSSGKQSFAIDGEWNKPE